MAEMSPEDKSRSDESRDQKLNAAIKAAIASSDEDLPHIDPDIVIQYLSGDATHDQVSQMQKLLTGSPGFRKELLEISEDLERLDSAVFVRSPVFDNEKPSIWETIRSFFAIQKPAFAIAAAYIATVAIMIYPTYMYFTDRSEDTDARPSLTDMVFPSRSLDLRPEADLRGAETVTPPLEISLAETGPILDLTLRTLNPRTGNDRFHVSVSSDIGVLWQEEDYRGFTGDDPYSFRLLFNAADLKTGKITIQISRFNKADGREVLAERYGLLLK